jgi:putative nucleotidyltransferase with HDIG domain
MSDANRQAAEQARARQVEQILEQVETLPTLSPIATRLLNISANDRADLKEIIRLIESDPALSVRILGLCKRADKGLGDRVKTVQHAVVMLGLEAVRSAVLAVSVYEVMSARASELDKTVSGSVAAGLGVFDRAGFWKHALAVACASELIARAHPKYGCRAEEVFAAGLLHDLGKLALELVLPQSYARVLSLAERKRVDAAGVERAVLGLDHFTAGKRVAEHWGLPEHLQDVIWLNGQPFKTMPSVPSRAMIGVVTVAKALCRQLHLGWSGDWGRASEIGRLCADTGLEREKVEGVTAQLHKELADRCRAIGIDDRSDQQLLLESIWGANRELNKLNEALAERSAVGERATRVLGAIAQLHAGGGASSLAEAAQAIVRSAQSLLGEGRYVVLAQSDIDEPWQGFAFSRSGKLKHAATGTGPAEAGGQGAALATWAERGPLRLGTLAALAWTRELGGDAGFEGLKPLTLVAGNAGGGMGAVLLHDRELERAVATQAQRESLVGAWAAAAASAARQEAARRLTERLAESSRAVLEMQARMSESEAMAKLGEVTAGAAHEMNNPLTVICGRAQLLARKLTDERDQAAASAIVEAGADLKELITSLHLLSQTPECRAEVVETAAVLEAAVAAARERRPDAPAPEVCIAPDAARARIDRGILSRALAELIVNAVESRAQASVKLGVTVDPHEGSLVVRVSDDGPGLSPKGVRHAFDPFFSEKPAGRQRGLGLTRARRLVEALGGQISLENAAEGGACATVVLPAWRPLAEAGPVVAPARAA